MKTINIIEKLVDGTEIAHSIDLKKEANPMEKEDKTLSSVITTSLDFYIEAIAVGVQFVAGRVVPVLKGENMLVEGTLFIPNLGCSKAVHPSEIICSVAESCVTFGSDDQAFVVYKCVYFSRSLKQLLTLDFAVREEEAQNV